MNIKKHIPNSITSLNLLSGCFSIICALNGEFSTAFILMIIASIFDFCDGFAARLLKAYSPMGKELDSLADMVSFGVAPSMILYSYMQSITPSYLAFTPLLIAIFSGLRLAKFNIDERQTENFIGLATPACALLCGSLFYMLNIYANVAEWISDYIYIIPILSIILSLLLVSEIPMFSLKVKSLSWRSNSYRYILIIASLVIAAICGMANINWSVWIFTTLLLYIIINVVMWGVSFIKK